MNAVWLSGDTMVRAARGGVRSAMDPTAVNLVRRVRLCRSYVRRDPSWVLPEELFHFDRVEYFDSLHTRVPLLALE